jgi:hypothetical protein
MSQPKQYRWTSHKFWCDECEAPRYASQEAIDGDCDEDCTPAETACSYGDDWAKECANPEGELPHQPELDTYFDRFDIVDAHYWFCVDYHSGQSSELYTRQCRISQYFSPSMLANGPESENGKAIYANLVMARL